jgi:hypothetical protein
VPPSPVWPKTASAGEPCSRSRLSLMPNPVPPS